MPSSNRRKKQSKAAAQKSHQSSNESAAAGAQTGEQWHTCRGSSQQEAIPQQSVPGSDGKPVLDQQQAGQRQQQEQPLPSGVQEASCQQGSLKDVAQNMLSPVQFSKRAAAATPGGSRNGAPSSHPYPPSPQDTAPAGCSAGMLQPVMLSFQSLDTTVAQSVPVATDVGSGEATAEPLQRLTDATAAEQHLQLHSSAAPWRRVYRGPKQQAQQQSLQSVDVELPDDILVPDYDSHCKTVEQIEFAGDFFVNILADIHRQKHWVDLHAPQLLMALANYEGECILHVYCIPELNSIHIVDVDFLVDNLGMLPLENWSEKEQEAYTIKISALRLVKQDPTTIHRKQWDRSIPKRYVYAKHLDECVSKMGSEWMLEVNSRQRTSLSLLLGTCVDFAAALKSDSDALRKTVLAPTAYAQPPKQLDHDLMVRAAAREAKMWESLTADYATELKQRSADQGTPVSYLTTEQLGELVQSKHKLLWDIFVAREGTKEREGQKRYLVLLHNQLLDKWYWRHSQLGSDVPKLIGFHAWWHQAPALVRQLMHRLGHAASDSNVADLVDTLYSMHGNCH